MRRFFVIALAVFSLGGECEPREQTCATATECLEPYGGYGRCVQDHCAFLDVRCPSSYRWDGP